MRTSRLSIGAFELVQLERHQHGPRLFVVGRRVHEVAVGAGIAAVTGTGLAVHVMRPGTHSLAMMLVAVWLIAKDWRDVFPSLRDTASWQLGVHRRFAALRAARRSDGLPTVAAASALVAAAANIASAVTPDIPRRARLLAQLEPVILPPLAHAVALPLGCALAVVGIHLRRRRRRAVGVAIALLAVVGLLDILKGLDVEEAVVSWACAGLLWWGRDAFCVRHERIRRSPRARWLAWFAVAMAGLVAAGVWWSSTGWAASPEHRGLPLGFAIVELAALAAATSLLFRPIGVPQRLPGSAARQAASELVRRHGRDTLAFFKLRGDTHLFFSSDGESVAAYRVAGGVLLLSGDPVGAEHSVPRLLSELGVFAEQRGLRIGAVGAGANLLGTYRNAGLEALYIGDEAIVDTAGFALTGRAVRKVRQSVNRLVAAGYTTDVSALGLLPDAMVHELERVSTSWRGGAPERGFAMAMDGLTCEHGSETTVVVARDCQGEARGVLHFVPVYGRPAVSLSLMRRDRDTPNGLSEFLVVRAIEAFREEGVEEISLNFAAFARWMHHPRGRRERVLGGIARLAGSSFQIESLYRFCAKFSPRWSPRFLLYERPLDLPRVALATMRIEGQLPAVPFRCAVAGARRVA